MKRIIPSWLAFVIYSIVLVAAYVWATFHVSAPFSVFAPSFTAGAGAYWGKRLLDKKYNAGGKFPAQDDKTEIGD